MPSPLVTGVAVMALLAFGVLVGSAVSPLQESAATAPIVVAVSPSTTASTQPLGAQTSTLPPSTAPEATPAAGDLRRRRRPEGTPSTTPTSTTKSSQPSGGSTTPALPPITHVFLIVLSDQGFKAAFGASSQAHLPVKDADQRRASCWTTTTR